MWQDATRTVGLGGLLLCLGAGLCLGQSEGVSQSQGYEMVRLPLPADILPSCMAVDAKGRLVVGSMDGDVLRVLDREGNGLPDHYERWAGSLPHWPLGMLAEGEDILIATRTALIRLADRDDDGWAESWETLTDDWDVTRDHHDWTTGIARWPDGGWVVSPVTDDVRTRDIKGRHHLRGKVVLVKPDGSSEALAGGLRYPTGWAARADGAIYFTDNQGHQKTTCEINRLIPGSWYGYASQADLPSGPPDAIPYQPAIRIPYPWGRSVNGLAFAETDGNFGPLEGQLVLCEYNNRFIMRASLETVDGVDQGACYPFLERMLGPLCLAFAPDGTLYVGSIREPAWGGEPEQGAIYRVRYTGESPFGLRLLSARADGFALHFMGEAPEGLTEPGRYHVRRYHHVFQGSYHSPPADEEVLTVDRVEPLPEGEGDGVRLVLREPLITDRIYEVRLDWPDASPNIGHYTMNRVPSQTSEEQGSKDTR